MAVMDVSWWHLRQAVAVLRAEGVIAYPTEAVWGLGCDPFSEAAFARILELKARPLRKGVILVAASLEQVQPLLDPLPQALADQARAVWPGPVTCVLPDPLKQVPSWIRGAHGGVAVRVSAHPLVQALCTAFGGPLVSTSCNPTGRAPARRAWQVRQYFGEALDGILPGALGGQRRPTRIIDLQTQTLLRSD